MLSQNASRQSSFSSFEKSEKRSIPRLPRNRFNRFLKSAPDELFLERHNNCYGPAALRRKNFADPWAAISNGLDAPGTGVQGPVLASACSSTTFGSDQISL